jgi:undecaprenyl-diphosphatase
MFTTEQVKLLSIGNAVAFIVAMLAIKFFITFLKKYGFRVWGVYRIIVGIALLAMIFGGWIS